MKDIFYMDFNMKWDFLFLHRIFFLVNLSLCGIKLFVRTVYPSHSDRCSVDSKVKKLW